MASLATPYEIAFQAENFKTGLQGVHCFIRKPGGTIVGPFAMEEGPGFFAGLYFYQFESTLLDPEGKYYASMFSPQDDGHEVMAFELTLGGSGGGASQIIPVSGPLLGFLNPDTTPSGTSGASTQIEGEVADSKLSGTIQERDASGQVTGADISGQTIENDLAGEVDGLELP